MSRSREEIIACPSCGHESPFTLWESINTVLNPELIEDVKTDKIFEFTCPNCGEVTQVIYPFLYHMMDKRKMIYFVDEDAVDETVEMVNSLKEVIKDEEIRIVCNPNYFHEKIQIFEDDRDDRVIEIMKLVMEVSYTESPEYNGEEYNDMIYVNQEGKQSILILNDGIIVCGFDASDEIYKQFCEMSEELTENSDENLIDREWALTYLEGLVENQ